jgi:hypothetical protein
VTGTGTFQQGATYCELRPVQRQQIDPANHDVPAQQRWIDLVAGQQARHYRKMLSLNQRHLPLARRTPAKAVAGQPSARPSFHAVHKD